MEKYEPDEPPIFSCILTTMYPLSKKISLLILFITSLVCSRTMFLFFNDPEGPNLLVVTGVAVIVYFLSDFLSVKIASDLAKSRLGRKSMSFDVNNLHTSLKPLPLSPTGIKRLLIVIFIQIIIVTIFYFCLN